MAKLMRVSNSNEPVPGDGFGPRRPAGSPRELSDSEFIYLLQNDLPSFTNRAFYELNPQTPYLHAPHIDLIASTLERCRRGELKRLIITLPPRHLKSHCVTISFVAWLLGHDPSKHIICASYGQELAEQHARDCRSIMGSGWYKRLFGSVLGSRQRVHDFDTIGQGSRRATSVGGPLTGLGADYIILDDVQKPDEMQSDVQRRAVHHWFDGTLLTRLNDPEKGVIIVVMQRLHQDDLIGHVLEGQDWHVLRLPALAEQDETHEFTTPFGMQRFTRKEGEPLHPARMSADTLCSIRETMGAFHFSAQYQQRPVPVEGNLIKPSYLERRFNLAQFRPEPYFTYQSWDTAIKSGELNDYSVCTTWVRVGHDFYLVDVFRRKLEYPDLRAALFAEYERYRPNETLIEDKGSGSQLIQEAEAAGMYGVVGVTPPSGVDKIMRFRATTPLFASGRIFLPTEAPWLAEYIDEIVGFPGTRHDDQVDSTSQALEHLRRESDRILMWERLAD
jgi:predicted phage terminase large subunit-like protein